MKAVKALLGAFACPPLIADLPVLDYRCKPLLLWP
jgi:hypothetical protein